MDAYSFCLAVDYYGDLECHEIDDFEIETFFDEDTLEEVTEFYLKRNKNSIGLFKSVVNKMVEDEYDLDIVNKDGDTALHIIAKNLKKTGIGNKWRNELANCLIISGADYNIKNNEGLTAIDIAMKNSKKFKIKSWIR